jgi:hypothetical protein
MLRRRTEILTTAISGYTEMLSVQSFTEIDVSVRSAEPAPRRARHGRGRPVHREARHNNLCTHDVLVGLSRGYTPGRPLLIPSSGHLDTFVRRALGGSYIALGRIQRSAEPFPSR